MRLRFVTGGLILALVLLLTGAIFASTKAASGKSASPTSACMTAAGTAGKCEVMAVSDTAKGKVAGCGMKDGKVAGCRMKDGKACACKINQTVKDNACH